MFDILLATALAAILLSAMSTGSGDSSSPRFCRSTSHALSAIRESNNGIYSDNHGVMWVESFCAEVGWNEGKDYVPRTEPTPISVDVHQVYGSWDDPVPASGDDPEVYTVLAGRWVRIEALGGICSHNERGYGLEGSCCSQQEDCPTWFPKPWHERRNFDEAFEYNTEEIPGKTHVSAPDEESSPHSVAPESCECPAYRCHERNKLWVQPPLQEQAIDIHISRPPTKAFSEAETKHIQLEVVPDDQLTIVERDFYITPSAAAAGFGEDDVHDLVDDVNEMLRWEHAGSDEYAGALRDYDSNWDGELDSSRGRYDRYVPVEFEVGEITIWECYDEYPSPEYHSNFTSWEDVLIYQEQFVDIEPDDIIREGPPSETKDPVPEDDWWKHYLNKSVVVTKNIWRVRHYDESEEYLVLEDIPVGVANVSEGEYNTQCIIEYDAGPNALLHEWGHNVGLLHTDPGGCPAEGHSDNHMNPALNVIGPWISEEEVERWDSGVESNQYQDWVDIPE